MLARALHVLLPLLLAVPAQAQPSARVGGAQHDRFPLLDIDTLFYIQNRGLERVFVDLNGHAFKLVTDAGELERSQNAFPIPRHGAVTFAISGLIRPCPGPDLLGCDSLNVMEVRSQGPAGSEAEVIIGDLLLPGQTVAYAVTGLDALPARVALLPPYPNPFLDGTTLAFTVPAERTLGVPVRLAVYDAAGRAVRLLLDARHFPGQHRVTWDGRDGAGRPVPSGVYVLRASVGASAGSARVVRVR